MKGANKQKRKRTFGNEKPLFNMPQLIGQALMERTKLRPREILFWISGTYPYYRSRRSTLQEYIQSALSRYRYFVLEGEKPNRGWCIASDFRNVIRKTAFIPRTINEKTGKLHHVNLEDEAQKLDYERNTDDEYSDEDNISTEDSMSMEDSISTEDILNVSDGESPLISEILTQRSFDTNVKPEIPKNDDTNFIIKKERYFCDVGEEPSSRSMKMEALQMPMRSEVKFRPKKPVDRMENDSIIIDLTDEEEENDSIIIDLTEKTDVICPICGKEFLNNENLGQHVISHNKLSTPFVDVTRMKETLQDLASTVFGSDQNAKICVFTGNVYLSREDV